MDLGLSPDLFWRMTPAQIYALVNRKNQRDRRSDSQFGMIVSTILNLFVKKGSKAIGPLQAMGYDEEETKPEPISREQSELETQLRFRIMKAGFNRFFKATGKGEQK